MSLPTAQMTRDSLEQPALCSYGNITMHTVLYITVYQLCALNHSDVLTSDYRCMFYVDTASCRHMADEMYNYYYYYYYCIGITIYEYQLLQLLCLLSVLYRTRAGISARRCLRGTNLCQSQHNLLAGEAQLAGGEAQLAGGEAQLAGRRSSTCQTRSTRVALTAHRIDLRGSDCRQDRLAWL